MWACVGVVVALDVAAWWSWAPMRCRDAVVVVVGREGWGVLCALRRCAPCGAQGIAAALSQQ